MPQTFTVEVHFQDGFSGDAIEVLVGGATVARLSARTRMQTSLAHIERLEVRSGQDITIRCGQLPARTVSSGTAPGYIVVRKVSGQLEVERTEHAPGYV